MPDPISPIKPNDPNNPPPDPNVSPIGSSSDNVSGGSPNSLNVNQPPVSSDIPAQSGTDVSTPPAIPVDDTGVQPVEPPPVEPGTVPGLNPLDDTSKTTLPAGQTEPAVSTDSSVQTPGVSNIPPVSEVVKPPDTTSAPPVSPVDVSGSQVQPPEGNVPAIDAAQGSAVVTPAESSGIPAAEPGISEQPEDTTGTQGVVSPTGDGTADVSDNVEKKNMNQ